MRKKTFRKYLRKLKTEAEKEEARALRSKQVCSILHPCVSLHEVRQPSCVTPDAAHPL